MQRYGRIQFVELLLHSSLYDYALNFWNKMFFVGSLIHHNISPLLMQNGILFMTS